MGISIGQMVLFRVKFMQSMSKSVALDKIIKKDSRGLYTTDTRKMPQTLNAYKTLVMKNHQIASGLEQIAGVGFYEVGKALLKAKKELHNDFGELKKSLAVDGLHIKQQERYMMVARNPIIKKHYNKMPPEWTFWMKLSQLHDQSIKKGQIDKFNTLVPLISNDAKWKDIEDAWGVGQIKKRPPKDKRETHYITINPIHPSFRKGNKKSLLGFENELKKFLNKYKFAKLHKTQKKDNSYYFDEIKDFVSDKILEDDTTKTSKKSNRPRYSNKKRSL